MMSNLESEIIADMLNIRFVLFQIFMIHIPTVPILCAQCCDKTKLETIDNIFTSCWYVLLGFIYETVSK